jgi:hypothetical protein
MLTSWRVMHQKEFACIFDHAIRTGSERLIEVIYRSFDAFQAPETLCFFYTYRRDAECALLIAREKFREQTIVIFRTSRIEQGFSLSPQKIVNAGLNHLNCGFQRAPHGSICETSTLGTSNQYIDAKCCLTIGVLGWVRDRKYG